MNNAVVKLEHKRISSTVYQPMISLCLFLFAGSIEEFSPLPVSFHFCLQ